MPRGGLFGGGQWQYSPEPLRLNRSEAKKLTTLGHSLARFQRACDTLYRASAVGKQPTWISSLLDAGKPAWLVEHQRSAVAKDSFPRVIRPDLMLGEGQMSLTELDSVPGGIGITAWLSRVYAGAGYDVLGGADGMLEGFRSIMPGGGDILISQESGDYRAEMDWLAAQLGDAWQTHDAESYAPAARAVYRFFELFDWQNIPCVRELAEQGLTTPPLKPHLEEKLWLALLWAPALRETWSSLMRASHLQRVMELVPRGWVLDPTPLPPLAALPGLDVNSWSEVAGFSQKERRLVLKISGFHELAWGSRGVFIGHDMPAAEWREKLDHALQNSTTQPWMMQEFREVRVIKHPVYRPDGSVVEMAARVRLCPYFFTDDTGYTLLGGCLATLAPADKKKIHGMSDGMLVPCVVD